MGSLREGDLGQDRNFVTECRVDFQEPGILGFGVCNAVASLRVVHVDFESGRRQKDRFVIAVLLRERRQGRFTG